MLVGRLSTGAGADHPTTNSLYQGPQLCPLWSSSEVCQMLPPNLSLLDIRLTNLNPPDSRSVVIRFSILVLSNH